MEKVKNVVVEDLEEEEEVEEIRKENTRLKLFIRALKKELDN